VTALIQHGAQRTYINMGLAPLITVMIVTINRAKATIEMLEKI